jgi:hypothetical protein
MLEAGFHGEWAGDRCLSYDVYAGRSSNVRMVLSYRRRSLEGYYAGFDHDEVGSLRGLMSV